MHPSRLRLGPSQSRPLTDASPGSARSPGLRVCRAAPSRRRSIHTHAPFRTECQSLLRCRDAKLTRSRNQRSGHAADAVDVALGARREDAEGRGCLSFCARKPRPIFLAPAERRCTPRRTPSLTCAAKSPAPKRRVGLTEQRSGKRQGDPAAIRGCGRTVMAEILKVKRRGEPSISDTTTNVTPPKPVRIPAVTPSSTGPRSGSSRISGTRSPRAPGIAATRTTPTIRRSESGC
jgi:hypothetical protein